MNKTLAALLATTSLMLALPANADDKADATPKTEAAAAPSKDYVVLKVEGDDIKKSEIDSAWKEAGKFIFQGKEAPPFDSMPEQVKDRFLREVASEHVLYKMGEKEGIENTPEMQATFDKLKRQAVIQQLLKEKTKDALSDANLKASYDEHLKAAIAANGGRDEVHARHILVKTKEEAEAIEKKLKNGASFEKLAKEKSEDKNTGAAGGDMGWVSPDKMVPEMTTVLLKLKKGEISKPVKTEFGWHVVQLEDTRTLPPPPFDDVKDALKQEAGNKAVATYVHETMKDVKVTKVDASGHESVIEASDTKTSDAKGDKDSKDAAAEQ